MTKTAEERAREIVLQALHMLQVRGVGGLERLLLAELPKAFHETERAVWLSAAEVAEVMAEGYRAQSCPHCRDGEIGCSNTARHLRQRAEEV